MLSISNVDSGHASSGYYKAEGYYLEGSKEAEQSSQFYGKAAQEAGLTEQFSDERFTAILDGQTPDGKLLGRIRDGARDHRPGIDLTFSAPKAVSIAALVGDDTRIFSAHTDAVKTALDYAEANLVKTRKYVNGKLHVETGGKIIAGIFQHDTSRALDPQLHTHAVVANMVKDSNGDYRSLSNEALYNGKMLLGQIYRNALANNLRDLGYEIEPQKKGLFDIKGVPEHLVQRFSKRREEIEKALESKNYEATAKASSLAALATRAAKKPVERAELRAAWDAEVKSLGIDLAKELATASRHPAPTQHAKEARVTEAVDHAVAHLSERASVYSEKDLKMTAMKAFPGVTEQALSAEIKAYVSDRILHPVDLKDGRHYTDVETIRLESENKLVMRDGLGISALNMRTATDKVRMRNSDSAIQQKLRRTTLTEGQKEAVVTVLGSSDRIAGVQGYAGTGKTFMLETAHRMAAARDYAIEGLAPSHKAVSALNDAIPVAATIESALVRHENGANFGDKSRTILAVDEASMMSSDTMNRVLKMADAQGYAKVVLIGDIKQLDAVGAGSPFRALQDAGMPTALMADIQRQRTDEGKGTVLNAIAGNIQDAMAGVNRLTEVGSDKLEVVRKDVADQMAKSYLALSEADRTGTGVIVLTNELRRDVNAQIQSGLIAAGTIGGKTTSVATLVSQNFTQAEARDVGSYRAGDIVVAPVAPKDAAFKANTLYTVTAVDHDFNQLLVKSPDGENVMLDLSYGSRDARNLAVFSEDNQRFVTGDRVKFKITDRTHGIFNSNEGTLKDITDTSLVIARKGEDDLTIPRDSLAARGMQLAYAATAHDFQGSTVDSVILGMTSSERLATQKSFYVALSRMRDTIHLVTDDIGKLTARISAETGERMDALEALAAQREAEKSATKSAENEPDQNARNARDLTAGKDTKSDHQKDPEKDPLKTPAEASRDDQSKDAQKSMVDRMIEALGKDQKQRDERSR